MSTGAKRQSVKSKTSKSMTKKAKKSGTDTGSKRVDNWRKEARALGKEKKYVDILVRPLVNGASAVAGHVPAWIVPWNPQFQPLDNASCPAGILIPNLITQGDTIVTRKDNAIKLRSLYIKGMFRTPVNSSGAVGAGNREIITNEWSSAAATDLTISPGLIRVSVVYDESPNGIAPSDVSAMFTAMFGLDGTTLKPAYVVPADSTGNLQANSTMSNYGSPDAFQNMRGQGRFRLLADEFLPFGGCVLPAGASVPSQVFDPATPLLVPYSRYLKLGGIATHFSSSAENMNITAIVKGGLYLVTSYVAGGHGNANPVFEGVVRLRFDD